MDCNVEEVRQIPSQIRLHNTGVVPIPDNVPRTCFDRQATNITWDAETWHMDIVDACFSQPALQIAFAELWFIHTHRGVSNIYDRSNLNGIQHIQEVIYAPLCVTDRVKVGSPARPALVPALLVFGLDLEGLRW